MLLFLLTIGLATTASKFTASVDISLMTLLANFLPVSPRSMYSKYWEICDQLSLKLIVNLSPVSTTFVVNLPRVLLTLVVNFKLRLSSWIYGENEMALLGPERIGFMKKTWSKKSRDTNPLSMFTIPPPQRTCNSRKTIQYCGIMLVNQNRIE